MDHRKKKKNVCFEGWTRKLSLVGGFSIDEACIHTFSTSLCFLPPCVTTTFPRTSSWGTSLAMQAALDLHRSLFQALPLPAPLDFPPCPAQPHRAFSLVFFFTIFSLSDLVAAHVRPTAWMPRFSPLSLLSLVAGRTFFPFPPFLSRAMRLSSPAPLFASRPLRHQLANSETPTRRLWHWSVLRRQTIHHNKRSAWVTVLTSVATSFVCFLCLLDGFCLLACLLTCMHASLLGVCSLPISGHSDFL